MRPEAPTPVIAADRCEGSARCVTSCPTEALAVWLDQAWLAFPDRCLSCGVCVLVCPTEAISIQPILMENPSRHQPPPARDP